MTRDEFVQNCVFRMAARNLSVPRKGPSQEDIINYANELADRLYGSQGPKPIRIQDLSRNDIHEILFKAGLIHNKMIMDDGSLGDRKRLIRPIDIVKVVTNWDKYNDEDLDDTNDPLNPQM